MSQILTIDHLFRMKLPALWTFSETDGVLQFSKEKNGCGILSISIASSETDKNEDEILSDLNQHLEGFVFSNSPTSTLERTQILKDENRNQYMVSNSFTNLLKNNCAFWQIWVLYGKRKMMTATYTSSLHERGKEAKELDQMIDSIEFLS